MTETQHADPAQPSGVDREHLRDYAELRRSLTDRHIAGVCGGLGRHLNIDPTVLRVLFVVLTLFGGAGLVAYLVAWLIVPEEGKQQAVVHTAPSTRNALLLIAGIVTAVILLGHSWGGFWFPWPLAIIGLVVLAIVLSVNRPTPATATAPFAGTATVPPGTTVEPTSAPAGPPGPTGGPTFDGAADEPPPTWTAPPAYQPPPPAKPRRHGPLLFLVALALIAIGLGLLGLYDVGAGHHVLASAYPALVLAIVGALLVVGAFVARPGGLIALGLAGVLALGATSTVDATGGAHSWTHNRSVTYAPASTALVRADYRNSVGNTTLDLTEVTDPDLLDGRTVSVQGRAGRLEVVLPAGLQAVIDATVRAGDITIDGQRQSGTGLNDVRTIGDPTGPTIHLDLQLFVGDIEVRTANR